MTLHHKYVDINGDKTALLLHGMATDSYVWHAAETALHFRGYNTLTLDLSGHGDSYHQERYSFYGWIHEIMDTIDPYPNIDCVVAHSLGGLLAAGVDSQIGVSKMLLIDPLLHVPSDIMQWMVKKVIFKRQNASLEQMRAEHPSWPDPIIHHSVSSLTKWDPRTLHALIAEDGWDIASRFLERKNHAETLLLKPKHSFLIPISYIPELEQRGVTVQTVAHAGHSLHLDNQRVFLDAIENLVGPPAVHACE